MNKQAEAKALRAQAEELLRKAEECEKEANNIWDNGHWYIPTTGVVIETPMMPKEWAISYGQVFTTKERAEAFRDFMQAMFNLRNACETCETCERSMSGRCFIPAVTLNMPTTTSMRIGPSFLWLKYEHEALRIAEQHLEELKTIQNFKWEI